MMVSSARLARSGAAAAILLADLQLGVGFATGQVVGVVKDN